MFPVVWGGFEFAALILCVCIMQVLWLFWVLGVAGLCFCFGCVGFWVVCFLACYRLVCWVGCGGFAWWFVVCFRLPLVFYTVRARDFLASFDSCVLVWYGLGGGDC